MQDVEWKILYATFGKRLAASRFVQNECLAFIFLRAAHKRQNRSDNRLRRLRQEMNLLGQAGGRT